MGRGRKKRGGGGIKGRIGGGSQGRHQGHGAHGVVPEDVSGGLRVLRAHGQRRPVLRQIPDVHGMYVSHVGCGELRAVGRAPHDVGDTIGCVYGGDGLRVRCRRDARVPHLDFTYRVRSGRAPRREDA